MEKFFLITCIYICTEYDHPCTIHAVLYAGHEHTEDITEFSLDLVSPVEYLFRKFFANEFGM